MEQVFPSINLSMTLLKLAGLFSLFVGTGFLLILRPSFPPQWKSIVGLGCVFGLLNAGLVTALGKVAFPLTPFILALLIGLYLFDKFPLYKAKHFVGLLVTIIFSSFAFFVVLAGTFFHLAVEGKI